MDTNHERRSRPGHGVVEQEDEAGLLPRAPPPNSFCEAAFTNHLTADGFVLLFYSRRGGQLS